DHGRLPGNHSLFWRMAGTYVRAGVATADGPARALLHRQSFRLYLCLYLGARDVAALPLRSADGLRLEVSSAAGNCQPSDNSLNRCVAFLSDSRVVWRGRLAGD